MLEGGKLLPDALTARPGAAPSGGVGGCVAVYQPNWTVAPVRPLPFWTTWPLAFRPNWKRP